MTLGDRGTEWKDSQVVSLADPAIQASSLECVARRRWSRSGRADDIPAKRRRRFSVNDRRNGAKDLCSQQRRNDKRKAWRETHPNSHGESSGWRSGLLFRTKSEPLGRTSSADGPIFVCQALLAATEDNLAIFPRLELFPWLRRMQFKPEPLVSQSLPCKSALLTNIGVWPPAVARLNESSGLHAPDPVRSPKSSGHQPAGLNARPHAANTLVRAARRESPSLQDSNAANDATSRTAVSWP